MKQKHLESALSSIQREFPEPKIDLEQYPTSPLLAASVVLTALQHGHVGPGRMVLDLGCGTGMLALACALVDTDHIWGVDCDEEALWVAQQNAEELELSEGISWIQASVRALPDTSSTTRNYANKVNKRKGRKPTKITPQKHQSKASTVEARELILSDEDGLPLRSGCVDTVLSNPPFGTKINAGMDLRFLRTATRLARHTVYSFHKTSTRSFLERQVTQQWGMEFQVVAEMKFDLPKVYQFHKDKVRDIAVDLIRVSKKRSEEDNEMVEENKYAEANDSGDSASLEETPLADTT